MTTILYSHAQCRDHAVPSGHPERPARLDVILRRLADAEFDPLQRASAPTALREDILRVHPATYLQAIEAAAPQRGIVDLDANTHLSDNSLRAAYCAVGACTAAVDHVLSGHASNAFCAVRPPGHHAETSQAMGFCLFANLAIAVRRALDLHGLERIAIVDFDVHHGNGTSEILWHEERIAFASTHEMPLFPGSGRRDERGAHGQILNAPLAPGTGSHGFRDIFEREVLPHLDAHAPQLLMISAGFDAHHRDPLATTNLDTEDFAWMTECLCDLADTHCDGRIVSTLEGGYDLAALSDSVAAHVRTLIKRGETT